ncbi:MAG: hypothetical protein IJI22_01070 [Bacilli bacterium]|nr:hypothetical protein [Bacilli bacterium]
MKYDYQYKITFSLNELFDINYIKNVCNRHPNSKILVEVQNTKGMTSSMIRQLGSNVAIRIAGGFDEERCKNGHFTGNGYTESVIYTRNETVKILEEIERIESGLNKNWSDIQKLLYVYDRLKTGIMYDPKFEHKLSSEIRSLRGLITKQTVCVGYALILKEFMDRNGISCEYAEGYTNANGTGAHSWNIVNIGGKKYPIDLTWDNTAFRSGKSNSFDWLGKDIPTFSRSHYPVSGEKTQDYEHTLSQIDSQIIKQIYSQMGIGRARDYRSTTYYGTRKDGSRYIVAQIGDDRINNETYYRYYYVDISKDGKRQLPLILYSNTNVTHLVDSKNFGKPIPPNYEEAIDNILFSRENIADSIAKKTYYIGKVRKSKVGNKFELVSSYHEIPKPEEKRKLFMYPTRRFTRSDGSVFIAQQMFETPHKANGIDVMRYDIFEMVNENGKEVLKRNTVFTERNFFKDNRQNMIDDYLSRERLDRKVGEAGGYIGYYDANGIRTYNPDLVKFFETSKKVDIDSLSRQKKHTNTPIVKIPSFSELKDLASKYEIFTDSKDPFDPDTSKIKIRDIKTGQIQTDKSIIDRAMFANIWLISAGVKYYQDEARPGANYAFNDSAEELYNTICKQLLDSCKCKGVIDTVDLLRNIANNNRYKHSREIIVNLFRSPYQTEIINKIFLQSLGINRQVQSPEPLYTMSYAGELAFGDENSNAKGR